jgi:hypothetical protein
MAALIETLRTAAKDRRGRLIEEAFQQDMRPRLFQKAYVRARSCTRWLRASSAILFLFFFFAAPLTILARGITNTWPILLLVLFCLLALTLYEFRNTHRALFPELSSQRRTALFKMAVAPTAAMRAVDGIQRELLRRFHPIAALAVPNNEAEALLFMHEWLQSKPGPRPESKKDAAAVMHWFREMEWRALEKTVVAIGISRHELTGAPKLSSPEVRAYCPRCRQQYVRPEGNCADCPDSKLVLFSPTPASPPQPSHAVADREGDASTR